VPLFGRQRFHGKRVYLLPHAVTQRGIDKLVLSHFRLTSEQRAHHDRLKMTPVSRYLYVIALKTVLDTLLDEIGIHRNL
jgi:hypothetical protein